MSLLTWVLIGVLVWLLLLAAIMAVFVLGTRRQRSHEATEIEARQLGERRGGGDRRIGLPDPRPVQTERRRGWDRRGTAAA